MPTWDVYCRVVDNHGDLGVCWRLAHGLAAEGLQVRLWCDDLDRLAWMAPGGAAGVATGSWSAAATSEPGDVVVETFGCDLPPPVLAAMARRPVPPAWIDLEYLTAEPYAERCHGLPSPQTAGPGAGLTRWFYYPGFSPASGGLLRSRDLVAQQEAFDAAAWLHRQGIARRTGERIVSLFCYDQAPVPALLHRLTDAPTLLLATAGAASRRVSAALGASLQSAALRAVLLPISTQIDYDRLLWASDLNLVRGEDSFVRAQLAGRPFLWNIYPQDDGAHLPKLAAHIALLLQSTGGGDADDADDWCRLSLAWNGIGAPPGPRSTLPLLPDIEAWTARTMRWRDTLLAQTHLVERLIAFAGARCGAPRT